MTLIENNFCNTMKIGIIGLGFVGLSFASVLGSKKYSVIGVDSDRQKVNRILTGKAPFYEPKLDNTLKNALKNNLKIITEINPVVTKCKLIFIAVGTPQKKDGSIDLTMIKKVGKEIGKNLAQTKNIPTIIIKSTVIPETTTKIILPILEKESNKKVGKGFGLITNPEFLRETNAVNDTISPHVVVIGGYNDKFTKEIENFYKKFHKKVPIVNTNHQTAEMVKYANNSFLATKISFINQIATICEAISGVNVDAVAKTIGLDPRIGNLFLTAGPGYGGSCLPKDVKAIINFSNKYKIKPALLDAVEEINQQQIENIINTIKKKVGRINNKKIAILGLAFKADTDDIRDSISIKLIELLLKKNAKIIAHDKKAISNTKAVLGEKIQYTDSIKDVLKNVECAIIMTTSNEYSKIKSNELQLMKKRVIIDSRRLLVNHNLDIDYSAIGMG
jgi:UDPglucose 6-dehydrogenase